MWQIIQGKPRNRWHYAWIVFLLTFPACLMADYIQTRAGGEPAGWDPAGAVIEAVAVAVLFSLLVLLIVLREQKRATNHLKDIATTDQLTGLKNRRGFFALAEQQLRLARRTGEPAYILYADVDDFKNINEQIGHQEGDRVLNEVARTLKACYRETDVMARFGGDEFVIMPVASSREGINLIIERFNRSFERVQWHGHDHPATVSFGLAVFDPETPRTLDELINEASASMRGPGLVGGRGDAPGSPELELSAG